MPNLHRIFLLRSQPFLESLCNTVLLPFYDPYNGNGCSVLRSFGKNEMLTLYCCLLYVRTSLCSECILLMSTCVNRSSLESHVSQSMYLIFVPCSRYKTGVEVLSLSVYSCSWCAAHTRSSVGVYSTVAHYCRLEPCCSQ